MDAGKTKLEDALPFPAPLPRKLPLLQVSFSIATYAYPLLVWYENQNPSPFLGYVSIALLCMLIGRFLFNLPLGQRLWFTLGLALLLTLPLILDTFYPLRLYPFLMASGVLLLFIKARRPEDNPMILPFRARILHRPRLLETLHRAKAIWQLGLSFNCLVFFAFLFAFSTESWAIYASFHSYLFLLFLFILTVIYVTIEQGRTKE